MGYNKKMIDRLSTYYARIEASIGSPLFRHLYASPGDTPGNAADITDVTDVTDVTDDGELSCAVHVSSVLSLVGLIDAPHATVATTVTALQKAGWQKTMQPTMGAIVVWPAGADGHAHIGFYLSDDEVVSNSTVQRVPVRHGLTMSDGRAPDYFLTHTILSQHSVYVRDRRNVIDKYRDQPVEAIVADLDTARNTLEIAVENLTRDFNMGTIIRTANAFNVTKVHVIGRHQWNKRGAMKTDAYLHLDYHETADAFVRAMKKCGKTVVAVDIVPGARPIHTAILPKNTVMVFGAEGPGISDELLRRADDIVAIEQFGSTRSINVGVAAGIAMYCWMQQHRLSCADAPSVQE